MPDKPADTTVARQVELAVCRLTSLSALPSIADSFLSRLNDYQLTPTSLIELIEAEPAYTAKLLSLLYQQALSGKENFYTINQVLEKLPLRLIREALLSVSIYSASESNPERLRIREQLTRHSIAVGCCTEQIAEIALPHIEPSLAYSAGFLHDLGKFALDEAMPRSFIRLIEQAKTEGSCIRDIERTNFGIDHTILGKRLAHRWHLPEQIALTAWLHHSDTAAIYESMPEAKIAPVVQLADIIARQCSIGFSGSYDSPTLPPQIISILGISNTQLEQIRQNLPNTVAQRSAFAALVSKGSVSKNPKAIHTTAVRLAEENTQLSEQNSQLKINSNSMKFITEFLSKVTPADETIEITEVFACLWQKFYQTGLVCLYLVPEKDSKTLETVIVEETSKVKSSILTVPNEALLVPKSITKDFEIFDAYEGLDWLFKQLNVKFDLSRTIVLPLFSGTKVIAMLVFELRHPTRKSLLLDRFKTVALTAGTILGLAAACQKQQDYAEKFADFAVPQSKGQKNAEISAPEKRAESATVADNTLDALAEMAAGAAHELNNPLSVISGRAQLLADSEDDEEKKKILIQIQNNAHQISQLVEDLLSFAQPRRPKLRKANVGQIIEQAVKSAADKLKTQTSNVTIEVAEDAKDVVVDSAQIVTALANIICNSFESYISKAGPINVTALTTASNGYVCITVSDLGCGMDSETVHKAVSPFFSAKPAGRKRGMGLSIAERLIHCNGGSMAISSRPAEGTIVTVYLPSG